MRKSKIDKCELAARNDHMDSFDKNMIKQDDLLELINVAIDNKDKQFFKIRLETDAIIKNLATLIIYNWWSVDVTDSLAFPTTSYI